MTRSARTSTLGGIVRPICFAVFRLITSSNFNGCSTGKSPGFAPQIFIRVVSIAVSELLQPFLLQPVLLLLFDFLIVLSKGLPGNTGLSRRSNLVTEAIHLPVIKAIQNLESKIDPFGGKVF